LDRYGSSSRCEQHPGDPQFTPSAAPGAQPAASADDVVTAIRTLQIQLKSHGLYKDAIETAIATSATLEIFTGSAPADFAAATNELHRYYWGIFGSGNYVT
jgi:hypothetical protein